VNGRKSGLADKAGVARVGQDNWSTGLTAVGTRASSNKFVIYTNNVATDNGGASCVDGGVHFYSNLIADGNNAQTMVGGVFHILNTHSNVLVNFKDSTFTNVSGATTCCILFPGNHSDRSPLRRRTSRLRVAPYLSLVEQW
jgi:hypothetical protein